MKRASLNHAYRLVWSDIHNTWVAVCETGKSRGKSAGVRRLRVALGLLALMGGSGVLADMAHAGQPLPTGGKVTSGSGSISQNGSSMTINQSTGSMSINWQGFSIGQGNTVQFVQPGSSSVAVNRVVGSDVSDIQGSLQANGQVFLSNPNGVLFSPTAQVNVGGLVATTRSITQNSDGTYTLSGTSGASVTNQGSINATGGGTVAMVAARIENTGSITAQGGNVLMGAGDKVTLDLGGPVKLSVDKGSVNALVQQGGLIQANGGQVLIAAKDLGTVTQTVINQTGVIEAQTLSTGQGGEITLLGDMSHGQINVGGTLDASAPNGGNGGQIETDAAQVNIAPTAHVTTQAANGQTGSWVIDPTDFTIQSGSGAKTANSIGADTLETMLGSTNVTLTTSTAKTAGQLGDINVDAGVASDGGWTANTLTLNAANNINVNDAITAGGTASLVMNAGKSINVDAAIDMTGASSLALNYGNTKGSASAKPVANTGISMGLAVDGSGTPSFAGSIDFDSTAQTLKINGVRYTLIDSSNVQTLESLGTYQGVSGATAAAQAKAVQAQMAGHYALIGDIDMSSLTAPIGSTATPFTGVLEGLGHTLSNVSISSTSLSSAETATGLFGQIGQAGVVENLGLSSSGSGVQSSATGSPIGVLAGNNYGKINNVWSAVSVTAGNNLGWTGGLVGYNYATGSINNSYVTAATITGGGGVGGLAGGNSGTISGSFVTDGSSVSGSYQIGGLVGNNQKTISASNFEGASVTGGTEVGGLVGSNSGTISASTSSGNVTGSGFSDFLGGLVGDNEAGTITGSSSSAIVDTGTTSSSTSEVYYVGGLVGMNGAGSSIVNSSATGSVTGYDVIDMGGLVGDNASANGKLAAGKITNSYATGSVTDTGTMGTNDLYYEYVGGLAGISWGAISGSYATGNVTGSDTTANDSADTRVGGLAGASYGTISGSYATGDVTGYTRIGGLVGGFGTGTGIGTITNSYATGDVTGTSKVGGLVGSSSGAISNSYATGNVVGTTAVGGLVGNNDAEFKTATNTSTSGVLIGNTGKISNSYATGDVTGTTQVGGLVGYNGFDSSQDSLLNPVATASYTYTTITNSYATGNVAGSGNKVGGLVGINDSGSAISNVYASGNVNVDDSGNVLAGDASATRVGGLVGGNNGTITDAYAIGAVYGGDRVGGVVGANSGGIYGAYATGAVSASTATGLDANSSHPDGTNYVGALMGNNSNEDSNDNVLMAANGAVINYAGVVQNATWDASSVNSTNTTGTPYSATGHAGSGSSISSTTVGALTSDDSYASSSYADLGKWTTLAGADGKVRVVKNAQGKPVWVMIEGETRPFLASEWSTNIVNSHQLQLMAMNLAGKYTLANDIDLTAALGSGMWSDEGFAPIGGANYTVTISSAGKLTQTISAVPFTGSFDGQGHTITGLTILHESDVADAIANFDSSTSAARAASATALASAQSRSNFLGLFGISSGKLSNITLDNVTVVGTDAFSTKQVGSYYIQYAGSGAVGSLVGMNKGTITNVHTTSINGASTVKTDYGAGGLAGVNLGGTIIGSDADAATTADGDSAGGLVGANLDGTISASTASGDVATSNSIAGGLAGLNTGAIKSSTASGGVSGKAYLGGLVGINATDAAISKGAKLAPQTGSTLANLLGNISSVLPPIVKVNGTGTGIIGAGSWATGNVAVANYGYSVGGLVGVNFGTMDSLSSASSTGAISIAGAAATIGGLVGENYGKISNSSVAGININQGSGYIDDLGGLAGYNDGTLLNTYASGTLNGNAWVGGLAAENDGSITGSHFSGTVNGTDIVGGLVGYGGGTGVITKSYAEGSVSATGTVHSVPHSDGGDSDNQQINRAGGLVGVNDGKISLSYATGDVTADSNDTSGTTAQDGVSEVGGLVADNSGTITQSYARNASLTINSNGTNANGWIGGLVGDNGGTISQSYAYTGSMSGGYGTLSSLHGNGGLPMSLTNPGQGQGGLVGVNWGDSAKSKASVATSFWNTDATSDTTGTVSRGIGVNSPDGFSVNDLSIAHGGTQTAAAKVKSNGLTTAGFDVASNFTASGWAVDTVGGGSQAWRLYTDDTADGAPLLKAFLTKLTVTPMAGSKVYDGTTVATYSGAAAPQYVYSLANADTSQIQGLNTSITLTNKNAGKYAVTGSGLLYSDQKGYDLIFKSGTYTVSKAALTIGGVSVVSKAYNGNTVAQLDNTDAALSGVVSIDQSNPMLLSLVSTKATGTFASKNVGTGIAVTAKGYTISGADAANYTLAQPTGLTGNINQ